MTCPCKTHKDAKHPALDTHLAFSGQPTASCLYCAEKHLATAAALAREQGYEAPNLGYIVGELVAAAWHLASGGNDRQELASKIRDLRHDIQRRKIRPAETDFAPLLREIDRLITVDIAAAPSPLPILIPLKYRPDAKDDELRILLRSIAENAIHRGEIIVALEGPAPGWLREGDGLRTIQVPGVAELDKDQKMGLKMAAMLQEVASADYVIRCSDDNVFLHAVDLEKLPWIHNVRTATSLRTQNNLRKWERKLLTTLEAYPQLHQNYDAHVPQRYPRKATLDAIRKIDWAKGRTIVTSIVGELYPSAPPKSEPQEKWKETAESEFAGMTTPLKTTFLGYIDAALPPLLPRLYKLFPTPSPWEK